MELDRLQAQHASLQRRHDNALDQLRQQQAEQLGASLFDEPSVRSLLIGPSRPPSWCLLSVLHRRLLHSCG